MKPKSIARLSLPLASAIAALLAAPSLHAAGPYYWDNDGTTAGFGTAAGTWAATTTGNATQGWSTDGTGATLPGDIITGTADTVNFGNGATGLGAGTITVSGAVNSGPMNFASGSGDIVLSSGGTITLNGSAVITVSNTKDTINSVLAGATTTFTVSGSGTLVLNGANTFSGKVIIGNNTATKVQVNDLKNVNVASPLGKQPLARSVIQIGASSTSSTLEFIGASAAASTDRQVQVGSSTTGSGGAIILNNNTDPNYTLTFSNAAFNVAATSVGNLNRKLQLGGQNTGNNTISGAIIDNSGNVGFGKIGVTKNDSGTWVLAGVNTYSNDTIISGGKLTIASTGTINNTSGVTIGTASTNAAAEFSYNNSTTALSQPVSFASGSTGGTLSGSGTITQAVTVTSGNHQTAGSSVTATNATASVGKETFSTGITYNEGSIFEWNLKADNAVGLGTRGTDYDAVNAGALATTGTKAIFRVILNGTDNFDETFWDSDRTWTNLFTGTDGTTAYNIADIFKSTVEYYNSAGQVANGNTTGRSFSISGTDLTWSAVPEPTTALAGLLLGAGLLRRRRHA